MTDFGNWIPITKNDEVESIGEVVISGSKTLQRSKHFSLNQIDGEISRINEKLSALQAEKDDLTAIRLSIASEAAKIILKNS